MKRCLWRSCWGFGSRFGGFQTSYLLAEGFTGTLRQAFTARALNALLAKRPCFLWHWIKPAGLDPKVPTQHKPVGCLDDKLPTFCSRTKNIGLAGDISLNNLTVRWHTGWLGRTRACMFLKCPTIHLEGRLTTGVVSKFVQVLRRSSASGPQGNRWGVKWHVLFI